jgi:hypothetical protein
MVLQFGVSLSAIGHCCRNQKNKATERFLKKQKQKTNTKKKTVKS